MRAAKQRVQTQLDEGKEEARALERESATLDDERVYWQTRCLEAEGDSYMGDGHANDDTGYDVQHYYIGDQKFVHGNGGNDFEEEKEEEEEDPGISPTQVGEPAGGGKRAVARKGKRR